MPDLATIPPEDLVYLRQQGLTDSQIQTLQVAPPQPSQQMGEEGAVAANLKGNAGGLVGGGLAGLGGYALGAALAPETGGLSLAIPIGASILGGAAGSYGGQKVQQAVESPDVYASQQAALQQAQQQYPKTSLATQIAAGATLSGGGFSPMTAVRGVRGLLPAITSLGSDIPDATKQVLIQSAINPAINSGIQYATTGQLPNINDIAAQSVGGALFARPNILGRMASRLGDTSQEHPQVADTTTIPSESEQPSTSLTSPWTEQDESGNYARNDASVKAAYNEVVNPPLPKSQLKSVTPEDAALLKTQYDDAKQIPVDEMRQKLHEQYVGQMDDLTGMNEYRDMGREMAMGQAIGQQEQEQSGSSATQPTISPTTTADILPSNMGGGEDTLTPAQQAISRANNSRAAFEALQKQAGLPPLPTTTSDSIIDRTATPINPNNPVQVLPRVERAALSNLGFSLDDMAGIDRPTAAKLISDETTKEKYLQSQAYRKKPLTQNQLNIIPATDALQSNVGRPVNIPSDINPITESLKVHDQMLRSGELEQPTYADRAEELNAKLEQLKSGFNPNQLHTFGLLPHIWDGAVSVAQHIIRGGGRVADAVEAAVAHIKQHFSGNWNEQGVREHLQKTLVEEPTPATGVSKELSPNLTFKPTRSALDSIRELPTKAGRILADALHSTFIERKHYIGDLWNPIAKQMHNMAKPDIQQVHNTLQTEDRTGRFQTQMLRGDKQRQLYRSIRDSLIKDADLRIAERLPVYRNGQPTLAKKNPTYYPDVINSKVRQVLQANTDAEGVKSLRDDFIKQRMGLGKSREDAESDYLDQVKKIQGQQSTSTHGVSTHFTASRTPEGLPLPTSWTENDARKSLATYFNRKSTDYSFFKHVEKNPAAMAALGNDKDAWNNSIDEANTKSKNYVDNINGNTAVKNVIHELSVDAGDQIERTQHRIESLATASILGPLTELHKVVSTFFKALTYYDNPAAIAHMSVKAALGFSKGYERAMSNGQGQYSSHSMADFLNNHLTWAERFAGAAQGIRDIYTGGQFTERFMMGTSQIHAEYLIGSKLAAANGGDGAATRLMKFLDPSFVAGKQYDPKGMSQLATEMAGMWHGSRDARTLPAWMLHDNEISAFMKLSSWGIAQTNNFMRDVWTPAVKDRNYQPLVMAMFGGVLGGYVIKELREKLAGKNSGIPSLDEIGASSRGLEGNIPALAYNAIAASSYAGFGGIISQVARYPFDIAFRNTPQSATFPLDSVVTNLGETAKNVVDAMFNSDNPNFFDIATKAGLEVVGQNLQLARVGINQGINSGLITGLPAEQKQLSDKLGQLRRFKEVEGLPVDAQTDSTENPLLNLDQKEFKHTTDIQEAIHQLPALVQEIVGKYGNEPDLMMEKLKGLKSNSYTTFPSIETLPLEYMKYISYLNKTVGSEQAQAQLVDYMKHKMLNEVKSSIVP